MRRAITLHKVGGKWTLGSGPDVASEAQRKTFYGPGDKWPKDVEEIYYQASDGLAKTRSRAEAEVMAKQLAEAEKKVAAKQANAEKVEKERQAADEKARKDKAEADAKANAALIAAKEASKKKGIVKSVIAALSLFLMAVSANAQYDTKTYTVATSATTNFPAGTLYLDVSSSQNVAVKWTFNLGGAGTSVEGLRLVPSIDSSVQTTPIDGFVMAQAANGTTPVIIQTNFNVQGYRYLVLYYQTNGSAQFCTNTLSVFVKKNAP